MTWLVLGILLWSAVHSLPNAGRKLRAPLIERLGENPYKGLFSLALVVAIVLMVLGWRATVPSGIYQPPAWGRLATNVLMFVGLGLFVASGVPTNLKRFVRHPQLTGVAVWSLSHLLSNGSQRAIVLFGGLGLWAIFAIVAINRRDGAWEKPEPLPLSADLKPLVAAVVVFAVVLFAHPWISGVSALPG